jgi:hypothetical protein
VASGIATAVLRHVSRHPERFAQQALGHNSRAVHHACSKHALMKIPSLEDYEQRAVTKVESAA